eukprot:7280427-Alexandrium_andersonii.AAC.1
MSASLVGSEMCIRDRFIPHRTCARRSFHMQSLAVPTAATGTIAMTPAAVSYTHLTLPTICSV